ncbi:MAG: hypothetical protein HY051_05120 [Candidatus Aenigmarchaeota archaeon]|nr:hypothetical protein [Candidatus Aenigmarchaeota archaeon]
MAWAEYSARFTPAIVYGPDFSSEDDFYRYKEEIHRKDEELFKMLETTTITNKIVEPHYACLTPILAFGGYTRKGTFYVLGRHQANAALKTNNGTLWRAGYDIVAGSYEENFIKELENIFGSGAAITTAGPSQRLSLGKSEVGGRQMLVVRYDQKKMVEELMMFEFANVYGAKN